MKDIGEKDRGRDIIADLDTTEAIEENGAKSARRAVNDGYYDWISSLKNVKLAAKAKALWRHLNDKQTPVAHKAVIVAALLYCIVPADMVPDFIPLSGLLDDLAIVLSVLAYVDAKATTDKDSVTPPDIEASVMNKDRAPGKNSHKTVL